MLDRYNCCSICGNECLNIMYSKTLLRAGIATWRRDGSISLEILVEN